MKALVDAVTHAPRFQGERWAEAGEARRPSSSRRPIEGRPVHFLLHEYHFDRVRAQIFRGKVSPRFSSDFVGLSRV